MLKVCKERVAIRGIPTKTDFVNTMLGSKLERVLWGKAYYQKGLHCEKPYFVDHILGLKIRQVAYGEWWDWCVSRVCVQS